MTKRKERYCIKCGRRLVTGRKYCYECKGSGRRNLNREKGVGIIAGLALCIVLCIVIPVVLQDMFSMLTEDKGKLVVNVLGLVFWCGIFYVIYWSYNKRNREKEKHNSIKNIQ